MIEDISTFLGLATQTWLWIGSAALFTICIAIFTYGGDDTEDERTHTYLHGIVCARADAAGRRRRAARSEAKPGEDRERS